MNTTVVEHTVDMAGNDGEFRLNAKPWNGSLALVSGDKGWRVPIRSGEPHAPEQISDVSKIEATDDDVLIRAEPSTWHKLLTTPPPSGYTDFFAAASVSDLELLPLPLTAERHLALRRFAELLRHAQANTDPAPRPAENARRHGTFDHAVGRYVHLDLDALDHRVYFEEAGDGIGLLCQHTAGSDGRQWRHLLEDERVTSKYRVIVYDLPYHGKSLPPAGRAWWAEPYRLTRETAMALPIALAQILGLERPVFIGSSVGGMLALDLARYHADSFRAVIALEGGLRVELPFELETIEGSPIDSPDPALHAATMMMIMSPTATEAARQETRLHYAQGAPGVFPGDIHYYAIDHDLRGEADRIDTTRCAVHLLTGEYDFPTVPWTQRAAQEITGSTMAIMEKLGHFPMSEDHVGLMRYVQPILDDIAGHGTR